MARKTQQLTLPADNFESLEAQRLSQQKGPFQGWKVIPFGSKFQLKAPNLPAGATLLLRQYADKKGPFYMMSLFLNSSDEDPEKALADLKRFARKL